MKESSVLSAQRHTLRGQHDWRLIRIGLVTLLACLMIGSALLLLQRFNHSQPPIYEGTPLNEPAAELQLLDQTGATVSLSDFRGQVVVLTFMDSQCGETCPLTAADLRAAYQALGEQTAEVVFLGINVNSQANQPVDVATATRQWQLDEIPSWHFLTGNATDLETVWKAYDVAVMPATEEGEELIHTPGVYLIDQAGAKRWYISIPVDVTSDPQAFIPLHNLLVQHIRALLDHL